MSQANRFPSEPPVSDVDPLGLDLERPTDEQVFSFIRSMPRTYLQIFDEDAQHEHAAIVHRRGARPAHVEIWRKLPERITAVLIAAEDRPGLLFRVSAALVAYDIDVVAAQAYGRRRADGQPEAVDLLWLRRVASDGTRGPSIRSHDVSLLAETLAALVRGDASFDGAVGLAHARRSANGRTSVRFERDARDGATLLFVETIDRPGLLLVVSRILYEIGVQIAGSHVTTTAEGRAIDRFQVTEVDGAPLTGGRQLAVQTAVLDALTTLKD